LQVLRYALYGKARNTFADASAAHYDWASKIRALFPRNRRPASGRERRYWGDAAPRLRSLAERLWGAAT
jgi:hypothetical protein